MKIAAMAATAIVCITVAAWTCAGLSIEAEPDVLDRPALISARAGSAVLLAMTPAGKRVLAAGERGIVLFSDDRAASWRQARVPVSVSLTGIRFASATQGWAVGHSGVVLHSVDGGASWTRQMDGRQAAQALVKAAEQAESLRHDASTRAHLREAQRWLADGPDKPFFDVYFSDERHGFIVGAYGLFFMTRDGGQSWLPWRSHLDQPGDSHLYCIDAVGPTLYIAGEEGTLYRSLDAGQSFIRIRTPYEGSYFGLVPLAGNRVLLYGLRGHAYWSDDGGARWQRSRTGLATQAAFTAGLAVADGSVVLVNQAGEVLRSTDAGRSFQALPVTHPFPFSAVVQAGDGRLLLSGSRGITELRLPRQTQ